jgi:hypothetical protein
VAFNGVPADNGEFVSPAFDLSDYALSDGVLPATNKRKTTTRVFLKCYFGTRNLSASGEVAHVQFSPDNGSTWYTVATSQDEKNTDRFTMVSADLSPYILETSTNAKIRFYMPWSVAGGDYMRIGRIWIHESDVPTNLGGMWLGAGGNIGIGTTNPGGKLDIRGSASDPSIPTVHIGDNAADFGDYGMVNLVRNPTESGTKAHLSFIRNGNTIFGQGFYNNTNTFGFWPSFGSVANTPAMAFATDGNVGIGTTTPTGQLEIHGAGQTSETSFSQTGNMGGVLALRSDDGTTGSGGGIMFGSHAGFHAAIKASLEDGSVNTRGRLAFFVRSNTTDATMSHAMTIADGGNVGIGMTNPYSRLHIKQSSNDSSGAITLEKSDSSDKWYVYQNAGRDLYFDFNGTLKGYIHFNITGSTWMNFTGQHRTFIKDVPFSQAGDLEGLIVSADQNKYIKMSGGIESGSNAITTNESLPLVSLSNVTLDKKCFGVISASEDPEERIDTYGNFGSVLEKELGDTRVYINSVGEGAIWVTNINGPLESGDYITTSNVAGYGQKQDSEFLANYTVAKITMDCDFNPATQSVQIIRKEMGDVNYWVKTTYENVTEEEYSNLADENQRTITETLYTNEDGETFTEQNEQSTYTELEQTTYQKITKEESKTEQEGYELEVRQELVNVLDEHGQIQWEDDPSGATEKAYKIRYLDADGVITDETNHVYKAAFVGCTYHCG